jgi:hypothetical protein
MNWKLTLALMVASSVAILGADYYRHSEFLMPIADVAIGLFVGGILGVCQAYSKLF